MTLPLIVLLIGLVGGALSGLLGIGGGIVTAPLLLYLPRLFGHEPLLMHVVGGLTISQALFASLFGGVSHWRSGNVDRRLAAVMSGVIFVAALAGGAGSKWFSHRFLLGLFLLLSLAAAVLILFPQPKEDGLVYAPGAFSTPAAIAIALGIGLLGGLVGQGGSFILIPMAVALLKVPLRIATMMGFLLAALSLLVGVGYALYKIIFWQSFQVGVAPLVIGLFFFASVQLIFLGVVGEYVGAIHTQVLNRPLVIEKERINF